MIIQIIQITKTMLFSISFLINNHLKVKPSGIISICQWRIIQVFHCQGKWVQYNKYRVCWNSFPRNFAGIRSAALYPTNFQYWIHFKISGRHSSSDLEQYSWKPVPSWRWWWSGSQWCQLNCRNVEINKHWNGFIKTEFIICFKWKTQLMHLERW